MNQVKKGVHFVLLSSQKGEVASKKLSCLFCEELAEYREANTDVFIDTQYIQAFDLLACPDLVILFGSFCKSRIDIYNLVARIRSKWHNVIIAAWVTTDPYEFDYNFSLPVLFDIVLTNDYSTSHYYQYERVYHLPPATLEQSDLVVEPSPKTNWDLLIYGNAHPQSELLVSNIKDVIKTYSTVIVGRNWSEAMLCGLSYKSVSSRTELYYLCRHSRLILNISSQVNSCNSLFEIVASTPDSSIFEIAGFGACQLVFLNQPEIYNFFRQSEIISFSYKSELIQILQKYQHDYEMRQSVVTASQQRVLNQHLYRHRLQTVIEKIFPVV
jgi:spore maturation protein CgeB